VISPALEPHSTYNFFQVLAGLLLGAGLLITLRHDLEWKRRLLLLVSMSIVARPGAEFFSLFFADMQGRNYTGALFSQVLGILLFLKIMRIPRDVQQRVWKWFAIFSGAAYALLRTGCFFRGCCWGTLCPFPWAVYYNREDVVTPWLALPLHPVQLYSAIHGILISLGVWIYLRARPDGSPMGLFFLLLGTGRLVTDQYRADAHYYEQSLLGFEPNTVLAAATALLGAGLLIRSHWLRSRAKADALQAPR
jgi:prolipoprotein diacylglyceryltransferase